MQPQTLIEKTTLDKVSDRYNVGKPIGEGAYGMVYEAKRKNSNERVALKKISKKTVALEDFTREMSTLKAIHDAGGHMNIAGVQEIFEDSHDFFLVMELVSGGEMFEHLCRNGPYSELKAAMFMRELANALVFLHKQGIVHADLKVCTRDGTQHSHPLHMIIKAFASHGRLD